MNLPEIQADPTIKTLAGEYADLLSIQQDLAFVADAAHRYAELNQEDLDGILHRALWGAAVVVYRRCFTSGRGHGLVKRARLVVPRSFIDSVTSNCLRETHQSALDTADRHVAHRVNDLSHMPISLLLEHDASGKVLGVPGVAVLHAVYLGPPPEQANLLGTLAEQLGVSIVTMANKKQEELLNGSQHLRASVGVSVLWQPFRSSASYFRFG